MSPLDDDALRDLRHDLRSPLVVIAGFASVLAGDGPVDDGERREYAQRILAASEDLTAIVDRALTPPAG
jgi:signal transduction histidine kinase